jgi:hypothetical protein
MSDEEVGTEEVKGDVVAEDVVAEPVEEPMAAEPVAAVTPPAPPAPPVALVAEPVTAMPPRRQTGLIVVVGSIVLVLVLALVFWQPMLDAVKKMTSGSPTATTTEALSPAKAKVTTTIGFVEAYMDQDVLKMKPYLTDEAQAAAPEADWKATAATIPTGSITFTAPVWSGDTTAVLSFSAPDLTSGTETTGTLAFGYAQAAPLAVTMLFDSGGTSDTVTFTLLQSGTTWRVVSESSSGGGGSYDATFVKSIITAATPAGATTSTP